MHLLGSLVFYAAFYRFELESCHIPGSTNAISRDNIALLFSLHPDNFSSGTGPPGAHHAKLGLTYSKLL